MRRDDETVVVDETVEVPRPEAEVREGPSEISDLKDQVRGLLKGEVLAVETIYRLLAALNDIEPDPEATEPAVKTVARVGPDGNLHAWEWSPRTGLYDQDRGLADVRAVNPPETPRSEPEGLGTASPTRSAEPV